MKEYKKPQIIAKNLPTGSYAAGCPSKDPQCYIFKTHFDHCKRCERST